MNLDKLKSDIANNEICVLVNGQPETVDFKEWCRDIGQKIELQHELVKEMVTWYSNGSTPKTNKGDYIYSLLDY